MIVQGKILPDVIVMGAAKAGTTSLCHQLNSYKEVNKSPVKEPHFFVYRKEGDNFCVNETFSIEKQGYVQDLADYSRLYKKEYVNIDYSTHYLYRIDEFIASVKEFYGAEIRSLKFIVVLRDPVNRALSHYKMKVRDKHEWLPIKEAFDESIIGDRLAKGLIPSFDYIGFSRYRG